MNLEQLKAMGLVQSNPLVKRTFKVQYRPLLPRSQWADPAIEERQDEAVEGEITVWLRKLTAADQIAVQQAIAAKRDPVYVMLHRCCFNEQGGRVFASEEEAMGVDLSMFAGLLTELNQMNVRAKKSTPRTSSGASSRSASAADPSQSGKNASPLTN